MSPSPAARAEDPSPMRVVHAVRSDGFAGVERYIADVSSSLAVLGHDVVVIGGDPARMRRVLEDTRVAHHAARTTGGVARALVRHGRGCDVLHLHMTAAEVAAVVAWPGLRSPAVATRHFAAPRGGSTSGRIVAPVIRRRLRSQLAISDFVASRCGDPALVVRNGVTPRCPTDPVAKVVLVAQRLEPEKRTAAAIEAWTRSGLAEEGWQLHVAGDGTERAALEERVDRDGIAGVHFLGWRDDLSTVMGRAGLLAAPADAEPFGFTVVEAMAQGLPVVACGSGGHRETVGAARPDLTFAPGDVGACARLLRELATDVDARRRAGSDLRAFQREHLTLARHVSELLTVYHRAVDGGGGRDATS